MVKLAHISDLHFGRADPVAVGALLEFLNEAQPDAVVATGDFTQSGRSREFREARAFLDALQAPVLALPGNHDTPVYSLHMRFFRPWARFEKHIGSADVRRLDLGGFSLVGANSARRAAPRLNWSYGRLKPRVIEEAAALAKTARDDGRDVVFACHHPFFTGDTRASREIVGNGEIALETLGKSGVGAVLTGHAHSSRAVPLEITGNRILAIQSGSATSTRQRGEAGSFSILDCSPSAIGIDVFGYVGGAYERTSGQCFRRDDGGAWARDD